MTRDAYQQLASNLQRLIKSRGVTRHKVSDDLNISYTTLTDWCNGKTYPRIDKIELLAQYFKVRRSDLTEAHDEKEILPGIIEIPIITKIHDNTKVLDEQNIEGTVRRSKAEFDSSNLFFLEMQDKSMAPTIPEHAMVLVRVQSEIEDGSLAAVRLNSHSRLILRRVYHTEHSLILSTDNPKFKPIELNSEDGQIIGEIIRYTVILK